MSGELGRESWEASLDKSVEYKLKRPSLVLSGTKIASDMKEFDNIVYFSWYGYWVEVLSVKSGSSISVLMDAKNVKIGWKN